jgi:hypothetical protein
VNLTQDTSKLKICESVRKNYTREVRYKTFYLMRVTDTVKLCERIKVVNSFSSLTQDLQLAGTLSVKTHSLGKKF